MTAKLNLFLQNKKKATATTTTRTSTAAAAPGRQSGRRAVAFLLDFACAVGSSLSLSLFLSVSLPPFLCLPLSHSLPLF